MQSLLEFMNRDRLKKYKRHNYFPKDREELIKIIEQHVKEQGWGADLNDIDTSKVTDMSFLFTKQKTWNLRCFNGDISGWDVSNVRDMEAMFFGSEFNGDISQWDVRNVRFMDIMFERSKFDGNIEGWKVNSKCDTYDMFLDNPLRFHAPKWYQWI